MHNIKLSSEMLQNFGFAKWFSASKTFKADH